MTEVAVVAVFVESGVRVAVLLDVEKVTLAEGLAGSAGLPADTVEEWLGWTFSSVTFSPAEGFKFLDAISKVLPNFKPSCWVLIFFFLSLAASAA